MLLNALLEDPLVANKDALSAQFDVSTEIRDACKSCEYQSEPRAATNNNHGVDVPIIAESDSKSDSGNDSGNDSEKDSQSKSVLMSKLFKASLLSDREGACPECSRHELQSRTCFTRLPENLIVKLNRTKFDNGRPSKILTEVDIERVVIPASEQIPDKTRYEPLAVVMHDGRNVHTGHYTIYRKQHGTWFLLNDAKSQRAHQMADSSRPGGQKSAMVLFKRA